MANEPKTILEKLSENISKHANKTALTFLKSDGSIEQQYTYKELDTESTKLGVWLLSNTSLQKGDRVMLVYPPGLEFIISFLSCLKIGIVAVPVYPPNPSKKDSLVAFSKIVSNCGASIVLSCKSYNYIKKVSSIKTVFSKSDHKWPDISWIITDTISKNFEGDLNTVSMNDIAFLQYTSGSTSDPKGVQISHSNLSHNLSIIIQELQATKETVVVSWLPQYHDMGLIGSYLGILYCGGSGYYTSPLSFLQRPMMWLEMVSKYRASHVQAPNFAYTLTARKYNGENLDLSSLKHMINGAEPVSNESIQTFYKTFEKFGLERVIFPTYGLAEHTVFVCSGGTQVLNVDKLDLEENKVTLKEGEDVSSIVGCGYPKYGIDLRIVHPDTCLELNENEVGEVWISSPSVAMGYYNLPEITKTQFHATLNEKQYLRTGDLGFLHNKELFICGRKKDLIIINGRNYYPQDIESTAESTLTEIIRPGCTALFDVESSIVLLMEVRNKRSDYKELCGRLHAVIQQEHGVGLSHVIFLEARSVPKTTSGKIARAWCRKAFLEGSLKILFQKSFVNDIVIEKQDDSNATPLTSSEIKNLSTQEIKQKLLTEISQIVNIPPEEINIHSSLLSQFDSLSISQCKGMLENNYGIKISDEYLFQEHVTVDKLVEVVRLGYAPDDSGEGGAGAGSTAPTRKKDCGEMLGCPPGVVKCAVM